MIQYNEVCIPPEVTPTLEKAKLRDYRWNYSGEVNIPGTSLTLTDPTVRLRYIEYYPDTDSLFIDYFAISVGRLYDERIQMTSRMDNIDNLTDLHVLNGFREGSMELVGDVYTTNYKFYKDTYTFTSTNPWLDFTTNIEYAYRPPSSWMKRKIENRKDAYGRYTYQLTASKRWKYFSIDGEGWPAPGDYLLDETYDITNPKIHILKVQHDVVDDIFYVWVRLKTYDEETGCTQTWDYPVRWYGVTCWDEINTNMMLDVEGWFKYIPNPTIA